MKVLLAARLHFDFFEFRLIFLPSRRALIAKVRVSNLDAFSQQFRKGSLNPKWAEEHSELFIMVKEINL